MADYKLDIFDTLSASDKKNFDWLDKKTAEEKKGFSPLVVMRWLSSVNSSADISEYYLCSVNENLNKNFWALTDYPDLLFKLGCVCSIGKNQRHDWIPMVSNKQTKNKALNFLGEYYPRLNWKELELIFKNMDIEEFKELMLDSGIQKEEEKELIAAFKKKK
jgi:hypothetical protein